MLFVPTDNDDRQTQPITSPLAHAWGILGHTESSSTFQTNKSSAFGSKLVTITSSNGRACYSKKPPKKILHLQFRVQLPGHTLETLRRHFSSIQHDIILSCLVQLCNSLSSYHVENLQRLDKPQHSLMELSSLPL